LSDVFGASLLVGGNRGICEPQPVGFTAFQKAHDLGCDERLRGALIRDVARILNEEPCAMSNACSAASSSRY
jgi:hypothetical protein